MTAFEQVKRDDAWVLEMSALEEGHTFDVGGPHGRAKLGDTEASRRSLAKFVELSRRQLGQSLEHLAEKADAQAGEKVEVPGP